MHPQVGLAHALLVLVLLSQLLELQLGRTQRGLCLTHTVAGTGTEAVEIEFVAQLGFELRDLHLLHLDLHPTVGELGSYVRLELGGLLTAYLALVEGL